MIYRIEFIGFSVQDERYKGKQSWTAKDWPDWNVTQEGAFLLFTHKSGKTIEVPRSRCVVYREAAVASKEKK